MKTVAVEAPAQSLPADEVAVPSLASQVGAAVGYGLIMTAVVAVSLLAALVIFASILALA